MITRLTARNIFPIFSIILFLMIIIKPAFGNQAEDSTNKVIDSIEIINNNIYDTSNPDYSHWIFSLANKLHIPTRKHVIKRELLQDIGDIYNSVLAEETARNLRSLEYIWNARADLYSSDSDVNILRVATIDRWSLVGGPSIDRVSGLTTYKIGFQESNFLGLGQTVGIDYFSRDFDEDYFVCRFFDRRVFGRNLSLSLLLNDNPENGIRSIRIARPFYSLKSSYSLAAEMSGLDFRNDYYRGGYIVGRDWTRGNVIKLSGSYRWGGYHTKFITGAKYTYTDITVQDTISYSDNFDLSFAQDSLYHYTELQFGLEDIRYAKTNRIRLFTRDEDITLKRGLILRAGRAWDPSEGSHIYDLLGYDVHYGIFEKSNLLIANFSLSRWFRNGTFFRKRYDLSMKYYNNALKWYTLVMYLGHHRDIRDDGMHSLYLGENSGIRGYPKNFHDGEKLFRINVENRFFVGAKISSSSISPVQFVDIGQTWNRGDDFDLGDMEWSVGIGLRISTERLASREAARIDLAYAGDIDTWQISFGLGQFLD